MREQGGFILVSALAVLAILAALVSGASLLARSAVADASLMREELNRDALTQAGLELAAYQIYMLRRPLTDLTEQRIRLDGGVVTLTVTGESGKVDLNGADADLLAGLWRVLGQTSLAPEAFAARVIDWRDPDAKRGRSGAERPDYVAEGLPGPANGLFESIDDVRHVLGVGAEAARALKPYLTVANPRGRVSAVAASRVVLRALPKMDAPTIDRIVELRSAGPTAMKRLRQLLTDRNVKAKLDPGPSFEISVAAAGPLRMDAWRFLVLASRDQRELYKVVAGERDAPAAGTPPGPSGR